MSESVKELAEIPQNFVKEGLQVSMWALLAAVGENMDLVTASCGARPFLHLPR